jgi:hypothetical protein
MRQAQKCSYEFVNYQLKVFKNNELIDSRVVSPSGLNNDGPLYVYQELSVDFGRHDILVQFQPASALDDSLKSFIFHQQINFSSTDAQLLTLSSDQQRIVLVERMM